ncbi:MAG: hypothetical protein RI972_1280 [Pseudomonadota bacterium]|jgi:naphthalene 1,2-dioxygenase system ferredoxin subunit
MSTAYWIYAAQWADVQAHEVLPVSTDGHDLALYSVEGQVHCTANQCTHGNAFLSEGFLIDGEIECPLHQGRFDVRTGQPTCDPACDPVRVYPVKIEDGRVYVELS